MSKPRKIVSSEEKLQYAKMVVEDGYTIVKVAEIADASTSAVGRWKRQYLEEKQGITSTKIPALSPEHQEIQRLKKALARAHRDNDILKKAAALFVKDRHVGARLVSQMNKAYRDYGVSELCRVLGVGASTYYYQPVARSLEEERMVVDMKAVFEKSHHTYGKRRLRHALQR